MNKSVFLIIISCCILFFACAPERNNVFSNAYHNTTAHYNAYYIAKEDIKSIEETIHDSYEWNYNLTLPIFPPFDSVLAQSYNEKIEHCIEKASLAIQIHKGSSWEDNAYILVGKARFYSLDYANAIETFKYVNTKGKGDNEKHEALVDLMRAYIEVNELNNAIAVSDYLKRQALNRKNLTDLYLTRGYYYQVREDLDNMVQNLTQAVPLMTDGKEASRINFIIGQTYQSLGFEAEAYNYYKEALKNNPPYELSFYTKLNMAQVSRLTKNTDIKKVRKYFRKLLKDRKNLEYKDKIYYEMAKFEVRHNNLELGMDYYNLSIRSSVSNNRQKAHSYWELGKIYYDSLAEYETAKLYYDSTMSVLPRDEEEYEAIETRQKVLENFVTQLDIIHTNDSLINLAGMNDAELDLFLDEYIAREEAAEKERQEQEKKRQRQQAALASQQMNDPFGNQSEHNFGSSNYEGTLWYFYNPSAVSKGRAQFRQAWGDRPLEDNWRRSSKPANLSEDIDNQSNETQTANVNPPDKEGENSDSEFKIDKSELIASIPKTAEEQKVLLDEIEEATYQLGNIYNFDLEEQQNAIDTFKELIRRFPETEYLHEVWYLLYLICQDVGNMTQSNFYKSELLNKAPESIYAKLIINPNYKAESQIASEKLQLIYKDAYSQYRLGNYEEALTLINDGLAKYPDNDFVDNMNLLKIIVHGKSESVYQYEYELNNFLKEYSESELVPYVDSLVHASEQFQINLVNSSRAKFVKNFDQTHFFVFVYETDQELSEKLPVYFKDLIEKNQMEVSVGNLILDEKYSLILLSEFANKSDAVEFNEIVDEQKPSEKINKSGKFYNFVITKENFNIFYQTKELDTYLTFYSKNYPSK
ncbi:type IX secretion system periplasmic lipoprotein PorW/SprE [Reichenbachiella ulvae]|uniref:Tetratricopeptide repeat-containing protein n=1 Tax=Reichenbachiella ulvae TaxID=2980104 RepID=A0ABT3CYH5_9BACT|nr:tetratricopeptide repeat protein [Reichenbachiella ulvae]MCV9388672.1 hypothetical protein [Reichenbachiella ulvae]